MRNISLFISFLIIGLTSLVNAQEPISFRSNALGGIIDDDLDLIYDPIELRFVGAEKTDTLSANGIYDIGEIYSDLGNGIWDVGELYEEKNENTWYDIGEPFTDLGNGIYDEGEVFEDLPIIIKERKGIRFYTNLSNLTSSQEQLFDNISDDEFLFGVSSRNPQLKFLWHSALVRFNNSRTPNIVSIDSDLDGDSDISNKGNLIDEYTAYLDEGNDGLYDIKKMFSQEKSDFTTDNSYSFILNNTLNMWGLTLGVKLSRGNATQTGNNASSPLGSGKGNLSQVNSSDPTFSRSVKTYLIADEYNNLIWSEGGSFESDTTVNYTNFSYSVLAEIFGIEFRGDLSYNINQSLSNINDLYSGQYENFNPEITGYKDFYSEAYSNISITEEDGTWLSYGTSIRKTFNKQDERKNDGFWKVGFSMDFGSYDYTNSSSTKINSREISYDGVLSSDDFVKTRTKQYPSSDIGEKKSNSYNFYGRFNTSLGEYVYFGLGGYYNKSTTNRDTYYTASITDVTNYNYNDPDINDYVTTETAQWTEDRDYNITLFTWTFPVGLEYRIGKNHNWSLRFGSIFYQSNFNIYDSKQITDSEPFVSETELWNGDVTIDITDNIYESISKNTRTVTSSTIFTYGIGCNPMENFQIDVLGFLDSESSILDAGFYRDLRISFTMKF